MSWFTITLTPSPDHFFGTVNITANKDAPHFCSLLRTNTGPITQSQNNSHESILNTIIIPPNVASLAADLGSVTSPSPSTAQPVRLSNEYSTRPSGLGAAGKYVAGFLGERAPREAEGLIAAYAQHVYARGEWSRINVYVGGKGRVVLGYRETEDEMEAGEGGLGLKVGVQREKRKKWWSM